MAEDAKDAKDSLDGRIAALTDHYFKRTRDIVGRFGDITVTYAVFMRRPVIFTPRMMTAFLEEAAEERGVSIDIELCFPEGAWIGAGEPLAYLTGPFRHLVDLETLYLQKLGAACVAAYNAYQMCRALPKVAFLAMDARHCTGPEMMDLMAYAASVGSNAARRDADAVGFIGNATQQTVHYFGREEALGTMPHALIGYAGSTLRATEMFVETFPGEPVTVLIDFYGKEISDTLEVCRRFPELVAAGKLSVRLDTHGGRFCEGLDTAASYALVEAHAPEAIRRYRTETQLRWLVGTGVSAAAIFHLRGALDEAGFKAVKMVVSSGFNVAKCEVMASVKAPIDTVGTGSFLPENWHETFATADIVEFDGKPLVKVGREFLLRRNRGKGGKA